MRLLAALLLAAVALPAAARQPPVDVALGDLRLEFCGSARRGVLFIDLYEVGWYQGRCGEVADVLPAGLPCAFVFEVEYGGDMPEQIPGSWRDELVPALDARETGRLRAAFRDLDQGDRVLVTATAAGGTRLAVNGRTRLITDDPALLRAFYRLLLHESPVAADLRRGLRG